MSGLTRLLSLLLVLGLGLATESPAQQRPDKRRSGFQDMSPALQAMQSDDTQNPALLWVKDGEAAWQRRAINPNSNSNSNSSGSSGASCQSCHGNPAQSMAGVSARYPAFDERLARPINLQQRINQCREKHQALAPLPLEHRELLQLESYLALTARGQALAPPADPRLQDWQQRGAALYQQRVGQLNLSCAQCHDQLAGRRLAGSVIPQAHPNAYPVYRLEWQGVGSLQRRLRNCATGVRAEPYAFGSAELVQMELYLALRASGMVSEAPGVRP